MGWKKNEIIDPVTIEVIVPVEIEDQCSGRQRGDHFG